MAYGEIDTEISGLDTYFRCCVILEAKEHALVILPLFRLQYRTPEQYSFSLESLPRRLVLQPRVPWQSNPRRASESPCPRPPS